MQFIYSCIINAEIYCIRNISSYICCDKGFLFAEHQIMLDIWQRTQGEMRFTQTQ